MVITGYLKASHYVLDFTQIIQMYLMGISENHTQFWYFFDYLLLQLSTNEMISKVSTIGKARAKSTEVLAMMQITKFDKH